MDKDRVKRFGLDASEGGYVIHRDGKILDPATDKEREPLKHVVPLPQKKKTKAKAKAR